MLDKPYDSMKAVGNNSLEGKDYFASCGNHIVLGA